jgi:HD-like signal output (HDOD) protein
MIAPTVSREALLHVVKKLPAAPRILAQLGQLLLDPNSDLSDVIGLLKHDSGLTARIIRVSNSAIYGGGSRAACLEDALMRVGFNEVYRLVGLAAVAQISDDNLPSYGISGVRFRENSLFAAFACEALAPLIDVDPRAAYTAGLLRSTGKIALDRLMPGPVYARSYSVLGKGRPIDEWENELLGLDNTMAAGIVMEEWRFPPETVGAIRDQYRPTAGDGSRAQRGLWYCGKGRLLPPGRKCVLGIHRGETIRDQPRCRDTGAHSRQRPWSVRARPRGDQLSKRSVSAPRKRTPFRPASARPAIPGRAHAERFSWGR